MALKNRDVSMLKTFAEKYSNLIKNGKKWRESRGLCLSLEINANDNTFIKQFLSYIFAFLVTTMLSFSN